ncbi:condensin complex subunit 3 [Neodiprion fabricii]|uniref:condensin complex subunit 3 n=1 Tax=Neodiprion fabricii TaxID=2872261 RepID=UPI001ED8FC30|nr:condensin complex subunit 3 [Neodiprion fabricii]
MVYRLCQKMAGMLVQMQEAFTQVQYSRRVHPEFMSKLKKLYQKMSEKDFTRAFISCLLIPLGEGEHHPRIENVLIFAAKFAVSVESFNHETEEEELCPFMNSLFEFLLDNHDVGDAALRFRMCYFMNMLLNSMGDNAFIDDLLCDRITTCMTERLLDKVPKIRAQAILALHRLQDPSDEHCPVIKAFIFHLNKDPQAEVRRAVLLTMGKNKQTLAAALRRTRDINDGVRKLAFQFLTKITVRSLTIEQREKLLSDGLRDRSEKVSKYVKMQLLPTWLEHYEGDFIKLLRALDAENALEISILMLDVLLKLTPVRNIIQHVPVDPDTKLIPFEKLTSESVIYWRCVITHLQREGCQDEIDKILPELSKFCEYIREFMNLMKHDQRETWEQNMLRFILLQLFEITKICDLHDEVGRENLKELIVDTLKSDHDSEALIDSIVQQCVAIVPDTESRLNLLANVISELRMPLTTEVVPLSEAEKQEKDMKKAKLKVELLQVQEYQYVAIQSKNFLRAEELKTKIEFLKAAIEDLGTDQVVEEVREEYEMKSDKKTLTKCLQIMFSMTQSVKTLCPMLRSLLMDMVLPNLDHSVCSVIIGALKATTVCCLLDEDLAKKYIPVFFLQFSVENDDIWLAALKGIFDLLVLYGLERLGMAPDPETTEDTGQANKSRSNRTVRLYSQSEDTDTLLSTPRPSLNCENRNIINILTGLLDNANRDLRTIAVEGLCKLLLHRRISSPSLVARLIILWHNPVTDNDSYLRQCLSYFFNHFGTVVPDSQEMLERSFLVTLKMLANAPDTSPLHEIEPLKVAQLILHLTKTEAQDRLLGYCAHNNLALAIIAEALNSDSCIDPKLLIRSLRYLHIHLEDDSMRKCLQESVKRLSEQVEFCEKRITNTLSHFKRNLDNQTKFGAENGPITEEELMIEEEPMIEEELDAC